MADSTSLLVDDLIQTSQAQKEVTANAMFDAASPSTAYGRRASACVGLTWGYYGTRYAGTLIPNDTETLGASTVTYMVVALADGAVSFATSTTNWNDATNYGRAYKITTGASTVTGYEDHRYGPLGPAAAAAVAGSGDMVLASAQTVTGAKTFNDGTLKLAGSSSGAGTLKAPAAASAYAWTLPASTGTLATTGDISSSIAAIGLSGFRYKIELANTTASDPGAGLLKFNNATPASATALYLDDSTFDSVDLSTLLGSLGSSGLVKITSVADVGEWRVFKWTATPTDNTGWWTFTVVDQAGTGTFEDDDEVQVLFLQLGAAGVMGDVVGPASVTDGVLALYDGTTGKLIKAGSAPPTGTNTGDETGARVATLLHAASNKTSLVDADEVNGTDSASSFGLIRTTWTNVKAFLKTYFDTLYQPTDGDLTTIAGLTATTDSFLQSKSSAWASRTVAQVTTDLQGDGLTSAVVGFRNIPQNSQSAAYTTVAADSGKHILHPAADTTARTFTIDSNANVAYPVGTAITIINQHGAGVITVAVASDTQRLAGAGTTGNRTLAADGIGTWVKITTTEWICSGTGLT